MTLIAAEDTRAGPEAAVPDVSVIIPAYNEAEGIGGTLDELLGVLGPSGRRYEVLLVDDGSGDGTGDAASRDDVRVIRHRRNRGYGSALKTGVVAARAPVVAFYDGDGQFRGADLERLLDEMDKEGADAALGSRTRDSHTPLSRKGPKRVLGWYANYLSRMKIPDLNCGLRAFRREILLDYLHLLPSGFSASSTTTLIFLKEGHEVVFVPVTTVKRVGKSTVRPLKHGVETAMLVMRLTTLFDPFRVFGPVSLVLFLLGLGWGLRYVIQGRGLSVAALFLLTSAVLVFLFGLLTDQVAALRRERRYSSRR
jgi:glycosyltransferase involved in cell wall biosynthesis